MKDVQKNPPVHGKYLENKPYRKRRFEERGRDVRPAVAASGAFIQDEVWTGPEAWQPTAHPTLTARVPRGPCTPRPTVTAQPAAGPPLREPGAPTAENRRYLSRPGVPADPTPRPCSPRTQPTAWHSLALVEPVKSRHRRQLGDRGSSKRCGERATEITAGRCYVLGDL